MYDISGDGDCGPFLFRHQIPSSYILADILAEILAAVLAAALRPWQTSVFFWGRPPLFFGRRLFFGRHRFVFGRHFFMKFWRRSALPSMAPKFVFGATYYGFDLWNISPKKLPFPGTDEYVKKRHLFFKKIWPPNFNEVQ